MQVETVNMGGFERAHGAMNAAYNALALDRDKDALDPDVRLARGYLQEAHTELTPIAGHDGADAALVAARAVLPRLEHAMKLLDELAVTKDALHVTPLLDELGIAMDHVEEALAAVGWD
ncbi:MAG: hypothetical protein KDC46_13840 [Thermoleophilia bacterium]|nr:hypothetical protein [Thermoleophilia bacterium]